MNGESQQVEQGVEPAPDASRFIVTTVVRLEVPEVPIDATHPLPLPAPGVGSLMDSSPEIGLVTSSGWYTQ